MKEFLRAKDKEAAELLRVTPQTIRKYYHQGKIKGYTVYAVMNSSESYYLMPKRIFKKKND